MGNKGAYIHLRGSDLKPEFHQFTAVVSLLFVSLLFLCPLSFVCSQKITSVMFPHWYKSLVEVWPFVFIPFFLASSKCQAHGICQHANADGTDVEAPLCPWHQWAPIWPEPCQPLHSFQCSDILLFKFSLNDPIPRQTSISYWQTACGVYEMGNEHFHHPTSELDILF